MKKIFSIILLALALSSCSDWLNVNPALEIRKDEAFQEEQGFQDILTGAYIRMATPELYGLNTSIVLPELITQHWTLRTGLDNSGLYSSLMNFNYTSTESKKLLEEVWLQYYKTIVNLNSLLEEIDAKKNLFTDGNYELIKGESLGLRAFLHFEVLRFFSAAPQEIVLADKAIPYIKTVTKNANALLSVSYKQVLDNILADLDAAETLLAGDPILKYTNTQLNSPGVLQGQTIPGHNEFQYFRQARFNYYAVKAAKARYYLFINGITGIGDKTAEALKYALEVIDAKNADGTSKFTLGNESQAGYGQLTFPNEHIFAVENSLATSTLTPIFFEYKKAYTQAATLLNTAYESTLHTGDIRYKSNRLWEERIIPLEIAKFNYFKKFNNTESTADLDMPLIRLAEMYFIATECGRPELFRTYRIARALDASIDNTLVDETAIKERLEKEYRKEFYGEGQMFHFYKRLGYTKFTWPAAKTITLENLHLPLPDSQLIFED